VLTEASLRKNFVLVYELLDEMVDFGYGQSTSTEALKKSVFNEPVTPPQPLPFLRPGGLVGEARASPAAVQRSVLERVAGAGGLLSGGGRRPEIFVDVVERLSVTFNSAGYVLTAAIDGAIQCRSFLGGAPRVKVALNESLVIGRPAGGPADAPSLACLLDDATFHEAVSLEAFEGERALLLSPPAGEFTAMAYRQSSGDFTPPFRCTAAVSEPAPFKVEVVLQLKADFPTRHAAAGVCVRLPLPRCTSHASFALPGSPAGQAAEYDEARKEAVWTLKKVGGGAEFALRVRATLTQERAPALKRELGPATLSFTIPSYTLSRLQVRYLQLLQGAPGEAPPARWVRYLTTSSSYVCRF